MKATLKRNLFIGFSVSLLILLLSSTASYISIRSLLSSAQMVNHTNEVIIQLREVLSALKDAETGQRGYLLTKDADFLEPYRGAGERTIGAFENVRSLTQDNAIQQNSCANLKMLIDARLTTLNGLIELRDSAGAVSVEGLKLGMESMSAIRDTLATMELREQYLLDARTTKMNTFSSFTPVLIIIAACIAVIITISFYVRVRNDFDKRAELQQELVDKDRQITERIAIIRGIADKISLGDYSIRANDQEQDSLGNVAGSLNKMAGSLEHSFKILSDKEWLQAGIAGLNDVMIGDKDLKAVTFDVVTFLCQYTNSHTGAVYLVEGQSLSFVSGYSFSPDKTRTQISWGEGLVGQAAAIGKQISLKNLSDENAVISFATGEAKSKNVMAFPVYEGRTLKGVIELATIHEFSDRHAEFIDNCASGIGIAIAGAQNRRRLQELLEETQSQAEELQSQHSELENINSELETQAEKLQAADEEMRVQQEELREANEELEERSRLLEEKNQLITERNIDIQNKAEQLAQSTRYKSEFLANMSHELRTPLNSILLLSRLLSENDLKNLTDDQTEYARVIQSSGKGLLSLIDEILDLSKIEAGKMELEYSMVSIEGMLSGLKSLFDPVAREKKIEFRTSVSPLAPDMIETDKLRLEQIIRNLVSNAIKFTSSGFVGVDVSPHDDGFIRISVKDSGIGIPKEKQQLIFEAFQQADGSTRRKFGGTGLGLSISRELARLLQGEIQLISEEEKGSEFIIYIPVSRAVAQKKQSITSDLLNIQPEIVPEPIRQTNGKYISQIIPADVPDDRHAIAKNDKVMLIIEDDTSFAKSLLEYTRKRGYKGIVSVRGDQGIELARKYKPIGILLDIQLPIKSGWEVMEDLKNDPALRQIPVHIMSSFEVKNESLTKGAVDFIDKPMAFDRMHEVFRKIEYVLTHHPKKVLIVEENPKHAKALAYFLETFDVHLEVSNGVKDAIESLSRKDVDCVILDMGIPDQKSYDTLEEVKKTPGLEKLPIIIFTGRSLSRKEESRIKQYADSIVIKTAHSYQRILDEVSLFLHLMERKENGGTSSGSYQKLGALTEVLQNKTVLVADDDIRNIYSLTKALETYKMKVISAIDGKEALRQLNENPDVDIVLMDMMMPELDGYQTTTAIRKDPKFKDLPVIAVTAKAMMGDRAKCISAGASDYVTKPIDVDQLLSLLRVWLYEPGFKK